MKLIIGLGNPGEHYTHTRHNAGFLFLDFLQDELGFEEFGEEQKFEALISSGTVGQEKFFLVKPLTFMNDSGRTVAGLLQFYKLSPADVLVVHDELDVELGKYKLAMNSRAAGHNGVQNIIDALGTQEFTRLRVGISRPKPLENGTCLSAHDYVLQKFSEDEEKKLHALFPACQEEVLRFIGEARD